MGISGSTQYVAAEQGVGFPVGIYSTARSLLGFITHYSTLGPYDLTNVLSASLLLISENATLAQPFDNSYSNCDRSDNYCDVIGLDTATKLLYGTSIPFSPGFVFTTDIGASYCILGTKLECDFGVFHNLTETSLAGVAVYRNTSIDLTPHFTSTDFDRYYNQSLTIAFVDNESHEVKGCPLDNPNHAYCIPIFEIPSGCDGRDLDVFSTGVHDSFLLPHLLQQSQNDFLQCLSQRTPS